jgi:hypothetical protein
MSYVRPIEEVGHDGREAQHLMRDFPKTALEFEERFKTEEDCRDYWIEAVLFECANCGHQTS